GVRGHRKNALPTSVSQGDGHFGGIHGFHCATDGGPRGRKRGHGLLIIGQGKTDVSAWTDVPQFHRCTIIQGRLEGLGQGERLFVSIERHGRNERARKPYGPDNTGDGGRGVRGRRLLFGVIGQTELGDGAAGNNEEGETNHEGRNDLYF